MMHDIFLLNETAYIFGFRLKEIIILVNLGLLCLLEFIFMQQITVMFLFCIFSVGFYRFGQYKYNLFEVLKIIYGYYIWYAQNYD